jgi:hypothetical protein
MDQFEDRQWTLTLIALPFESDVKEDGLALVYIDRYVANPGRYDETDNTLKLAISFTK